MGINLATWPTARNDADEGKWEGMVRRWFRDGIHGTTTDTNHMNPYADSTGMHVKVDTGEAIIHGFHCEVSTLETLSISAADATHDRLDLVALRLDTTTSPVTISLQVLTGAPAVTPVLPNLTNTLTVVDVPIASVLVNAGVSTIASAKVGDRRAYFAPRLNSWQSYSPAVSLMSGATFTLSAQSVNYARWRIDYDLCEIAMELVVTMAGTPGGGLLVALPAQARNYASPLVGDVAGTVARCFTSNGTVSPVVYAELQPSSGDTFTVDGSPHTMHLAGSFEVTPFI